MVIILNENNNGDCNDGGDDHNYGVIRDTKIIVVIVSTLTKINY